MSLSRRVARPLLAAMFVAGGLDALRNPKGKVEAAATVLDPLGWGDRTVELVRLNGAVQVGAGSMLALGIWPRLAALGLIGSIVPTTAAGHRFWEEEDPGARASQRIHFLKNLSMLGGLLLAALDTEGEPSVSWRARRTRPRTSVHASPTRPTPSPGTPSDGGRRGTPTGDGKGAPVASPGPAPGGKLARRTGQATASEGVVRWTTSGPGSCWPKSAGGWRRMRGAGARRPGRRGGG